MGRANQQRDWLNFVPRPDLKGKRKTDIWAVEREDGLGAALGYVKWHGAWRQYCFFPDTATLYNADCLRQIADFCQRKRAEYLAKKSGGGDG